MWKSTFYILGSVHCNYRLKESNEIQQYEHIYLLLNYCTCFGHPSRPSSGLHKTSVVASGKYKIWTRTVLRFSSNFCTLRYDLYQRLQLQFYVLLTMGAMDARNM